MSLGAGVAGGALGLGWSGESRAQAAQAQASVGAGADTATTSEVVVTASKRPEKLRDVAASITAFTQSDLTAINAQSFADYLGRAPGVVFDASTPGVSNVVIRGVGTATVFPDQGQSTTGIYLNSIPLTDPGFAVSTPDVDVFDMQRVEVLRGPQGTLYGSATLGGAVNYITNPVSLTRYQAAVETSVSGVENGDQVGTTIKGVVNLPLLADTLGVRLTGIRRFDPGYLDNVGIGRTDTNSRQVNDFRADVFWQVRPGLSLDFQSFYDSSHNGDGFYSFPSEGKLTRDTITPELASFQTKIQSLKLSEELGFANFEVIAANSRKSLNALGDVTPYFGAPTISPAIARTNANSVEARLTSPTGQKFEWLIGGFYDHYVENYPTPTLQGGVDVFDFTVRYISREVAGFGEATYHINDQWRVTFGGRYYDIDITTADTQGDPSTPPESVQSGKEHDSGFSPKGSLTFEPNRDFMAYLLVSKGFRQGGVNLLTPASVPGTPATYGSDSLVNYELGVRPAWFHHRLTLDSTLFYIDWSNVQIRLNPPTGTSYVANAGAARNIGWENALVWTPTPSLSLQVNATYLNSELSKRLDLGSGVVVKAGATLPGASHLITSETATYRFNLAYKPYLTLSHRYVSAASSAFVYSLPQGNYNVFDAFAGVSFGNADLSIYANNIGDRRGITTSAFFGEQTTYFYLRPRTVGVRLGYRL